MAITIDLPPDEEQTLGRRAETAGLDVAAYLMQCAGLRLPQYERPSDEEFYRLPDGLAESVDPSIPPLSDYAVSREGIYEERTAKILGEEYDGLPR